MTVKESGNLAVRNPLLRHLNSEILYYLPCRRQVTLSKYFYILTKLSLLLWAEFAVREVSVVTRRDYASVLLRQR